MQKFKIKYKAGGFVDRTFTATVAEAEAIHAVINVWGVPLAFPLQRHIGTSFTDTNYIQYKFNSSKFITSTFQAVEFYGYCDIWGWGFKAKAGTRKETNYNIINSFLMSLGPGYSQTIEVKDHGSNEYCFYHSIVHDSLTLRLRMTETATFAQLDTLSQIIARSGTCDIYATDFLDFGIEVLNLIQPVNIRFMRIDSETGEAVGGDVLCSAGVHQNTVKSVIETIGFDIVSEQDYFL